MMSLFRKRITPLSGYNLKAGVAPFCLQNVFASNLPFSRWLCQSTLMLDLFESLSLTLAQEYSALLLPRFYNPVPKLLLQVTIRRCSTTLPEMSPPTSQNILLLWCALSGLGKSHNIATLWIGFSILSSLPMLYTSTTLSMRNGLNNALRSFWLGLLTATALCSCSPLQRKRWCLLTHCSRKIYRHTRMVRSDC